MKAQIILRVRAGAPKTRFAGPHADSWKIFVAAPPVDGKANDALVRYLAKLIGLSTSAVRIVSGKTAPLKIIEIEGISAESLLRVILEANGPRKNSGIPAPPES